jgi:3-dehydroshikimate dehydratase
MIHTGLVSITFRSLSPQEIVALVAKAGLRGIEWGGDIHVPHGNVQRAKEVYQMTSDAGLEISAYGSYYRVGCEEKEGILFERVLDTAIALKAPVIRVWAGDRGSREADEEWWAKVIDETYRIGALTKESGITISFEYHGNTLTDTGESAFRLMKAVGGEGITCYWQPPVGLEDEQRMTGLRQILPWLGNIHVFWWNIHERRPLAEGMEAWREYIELIGTAQGDRFCMLEFVKDDDPDQFLKDAASLKVIVDGSKG